MFVALDYTFVVTPSFYVSRNPFASVILSLYKSISNCLEYKSSYTMIIFICSVLVVKVYHKGVNGMCMLSGVLADIFTSSSTN